MSRGPRGAWPVGSVDLLGPQRRSAGGSMGHEPQRSAPQELLRCGPGRRRGCSVPRETGPQMLRLRSLEKSPQARSSSESRYPFCMDRVGDSRDNHALMIKPLPSIFMGQA